jgi:hypothetical protein
MKLRLCTVAACMVVTLGMPARAVGADRETGWQPGITLAPYGWLAGLDGTMGSNGSELDDGGITLPPRFDVSTDELWDEIGFMFYGEWRGERWTAFVDSVWANVSQDGDVKLGTLLPSSQAAVTFDGKIYQVGIGYRVLDWDRSFITVYGGGRYYDIESVVEASGGILPRKVEASTSRSWSDAVVGGRWSQEFGERWNTTLIADYGFGNSESVWQVFGTVGYEFSWGTVRAGYRYMNLDYETTTYKINLSLSGPVLGASFNF